MKKALMDYKEQLIPILNKLRNGQPLTPEEEESVDMISMRERMKLEDDMRPYEIPAYEEGKAYVDNVLDSGGDVDDLKAEWKGYQAGLIQDYKDHMDDHPVPINYLKRELPPEAKIRDVVRDRAAGMGTRPRAHAAEAAKLRGIDQAIFDHESDDLDDYEGWDDDDE